MSVWPETPFQTSFRSHHHRPWKPSKTSPGQSTTFPKAWSVRGFQFPSGVVSSDCTLTWWQSDSEAFPQWNAHMMSARRPSWQDFQGSYVRPGQYTFSLGLSNSSHALIEARWKPLSEDLHAGYDLSWLREAGGMLGVRSLTTGSQCPQRQIR